MMKTRPVILVHWDAKIVLMLIAVINVIKQSILLWLKVRIDANVKVLIF